MRFMRDQTKEIRIKVWTALREAAVCAASAHQLSVMERTETSGHAL